MKRVLLVLLAACGGGHARAPIAVTSTTPLEHEPFDQIVESGDAVYLFGPSKIVIMRNGAVVTSVAIPDPCKAPQPPHTFCSSMWPVVHDWSGAATIPALDGDGRWVVASYWGSLKRVLSTGETEDIGDRLGLGNAHVKSIVSSGTTVAYGLDDATAITTDGVHLQRYPITGELALAHDRLAITNEHAIEVWDLAHGTRVTFAIAHAHAAFLDAKLIVTTEHGLWIEDHGKLVPIRVPAGTFAATVAGSRLWVRVGTTLYAYDHDHLRRTSTSVEDNHPVQIGSTSGDLWINTVDYGDGGLEGGDLHRYTLDHANADPRWTSEVAPVFQRVCSHCHLPGGDADVDLSTPATWAAERAEIVRRVLVTHTMPPAGTELSDPDRRSLEGWLRATP